MKELMGNAFNPMLMPDGEGGLRGFAELVLITSEPVYFLDAAGEMRAKRETQHVRLGVTASSLEKFAKALLGYASELKTLEDQAELHPGGVPDRQAHRLPPDERGRQAMITIACDGCGSTERLVDNKPAVRIKRAKISLSTMSLEGNDGTARGEKCVERDLCLSCWQRALECCDPINWPRAARGEDRPKGSG